MTTEVNEIVIPSDKLKNPILEEYARKYKPEELTDDGIPNIETQLRELKERDEEQLPKYDKEDALRYKREMTQRVKCIGLHKMGKSIMMNTLALSQKDRQKLQLIMHSYNDTDHNEIIKEFSDVCQEQLFTDNTDWSKYPIYEK